jgi:hypothetical protein
MERLDPSVMPQIFGPDIGRNAMRIKTCRPPEAMLGGNPVRMVGREENGPARH